MRVLILSAFVAISGCATQAPAQPAALVPANPATAETPKAAAPHDHEHGAAKPEAATNAASQGCPMHAAMAMKTAEAGMCQCGMKPGAKPSATATEKEKDK